MFYPPVPPLGRLLVRWAWSPPCRMAVPPRKGVGCSRGSGCATGSFMCSLCDLFLLYFLVIFARLSRISPVRYFSAGRFAPLPRSGRRSRSPKISGTPQGGSGLPGTPQAQSAGGTKNGSNFGAVVGVAACRHSGGVNIPQGNIRKG